MVRGLQQYIVLHARGIAADQYCPGPDLCGDGRSSATRIVDVTADLVKRDHFMLSAMCGHHDN
jgi:hypothetical protein